MVNQNMRKQSDNAPLSVRIRRFVDDARKVRFIIQDKESLTPYISASIYEASLIKKYKSNNTISDAMQKLTYVYDWAKGNNVNVDELFLRGESLSEVQINQFDSWLDERRVRGSSGKLEDLTINSILDRTSIATRWFVDQYSKIPGSNYERAISIAIYKDQIMARFSGRNRKVVNKRIADDLTDEELLIIENFLKPDNRAKKYPGIHKAQLIRDYLIWRLIFEFGLRQSEVLALRLEDCPHRDQNFIKIVRIEDRGDDYFDPRETYAPRPKTLSRELGFLFFDSQIKKLINDYITKYRRRRFVEHGVSKYRIIMDNPAFLILSHKNDVCNPLSISSMQNIATSIKDETGIEGFHWHLVRHAFFNRRYAEAMKMKEKNHETYVERIKDLIYWGGWEDENSLQMYIQKARRDRAINMLQENYE